MTVFIVPFTIVICRPPKRTDSKEEKRKRRHHRESESEKTNQADEIVQNSNEVDPKENHPMESENCDKERNESHPPVIPLSGNFFIFLLLMKRSLKVPISLHLSSFTQ